ncbi:hypothetical protein FPQ18DRAFT_387453 [Pyronema domesticum]|nr:hypothetical protein FPQ18DRAFT_387453 [Pyronema domesticum]
MSDRFRRSNAPSPEEMESIPPSRPRSETPDLPQRFVRSNAPSPEERPSTAVMRQHFQNPRRDSERCRDSLRQIWARVPDIDRVSFAPYSAEEQRPSSVDIPSEEGRERLTILIHRSSPPNRHEPGPEGQRGRSLFPDSWERLRIMVPRNHPPNRHESGPAGQRGRSVSPHFSDWINVHENEVVTISDPSDVAETVIIREPTGSQVRGSSLSSPLVERMTPEGQGDITVCDPSNFVSADAEVVED